MATLAPDDLKAFRADAMAACGFTDPVEIGIVGDPAHEERGGYHISGNAIAATGRFDRDFSTKRTPDHFLPNAYASAVDIGDDWPHGGRAAWLRFNNNVLYEMINHPDVLTTVRAINCSTDGSNRKRYDKANAGQGVINSTDTVTIHTHLEFWRNTNGTAARAADLKRLLAHINTAITGEPLDPPPVAPPTSIGDSEMIYQVTSVPTGTVDFAGTSVPENGQCMATPAGPFALTGTEFFSLPTSAQAVRIKMTWERLMDFCDGLKQPMVMTDGQTAAVAAAAEGGARSAIDGATLHAAPEV